MSCVFVLCSWDWVVWTFLGRFTEEESMKRALCGPAVSCGRCYCLSVSPTVQPVPASLLCAGFMILVREPHRPTLRVTWFPCFPIFMPFLGDSPPFSLLLPFVCVYLISFQKPSSSIPFIRRLSLVLSLPYLLSWGVLPVHLLGCCITFYLVL